MDASHLWISCQVHIDQGHQSQKSLWFTKKTLQNTTHTCHKHMRISGLLSNNQSHLNRQTPHLSKAISAQKSTMLERPSCQIRRVNSHTPSQCCNEYMMVMVKIDSNAILVELLKSQLDQELIHAYDSLIRWCQCDGITLMKHILNNKISTKNL